MSRSDDATTDQTLSLLRVIRRLMEGEEGVQARHKIGVERRRRGRLAACPDDTEADDRGAAVLAGRRPGLALEHCHIVRIECAAGRAARGAALESAGRVATNRRNPCRAQRGRLSRHVNTS